MRRPSILVGLVALALALVSGCSDPPTAPGQPVVSSTPAPAPVVTSIKVTGTVALSAIGQATQLTATAAYSDATTKDVTATTNWVSESPSVVAVSPSGLVTVVAFGAGNIHAEFQSKHAFLFMTATPPNTSVFYGRVREPGNSGIPAVRVLETQSGQSTLTDSAGTYSFGALSMARLTFEKEGYEPVGQLEALPNQFNDMALQRVVRVTAGGSLTGLQLAPNDVSYAVGGDRCAPCKLIRVTMPAAGSLHVNLTWTEPRATALNLWVNGGRFVGTGTSSDITRDVPVPAGEVLVYVGFNSLGGALFYVPFNLATSTSVTP